MAKEWYLMNTNSDTVSGFESDSFDNFATDAFGEALASSLGKDVEICNYDLSERTKARVIVQGNVQDTKLKSMQRMVLAPIGTCKAGQYVYYKERYWLIVGLVDDNGMYEKAVLVLCNHLLTWKNENGDIIQRWVNASSASQYNNGETSNKFYFVRSDQLMILTPDDDECLLIKHKQRFIIDEEFINEFNEAIKGDGKMRLDFANAYAEAMEIVNTKKDSFNSMANTLKTVINSVMEKMSPILSGDAIQKFTEIADNIAKGNIGADAFVEAYGKSQRIKDIASKE